MSTQESYAPSLPSSLPGDVYHPRVADIRRSGAMGQDRDIMLVLPDDDYRRSLSTYLRKQGFSVVEADDTQAAITRIVTGEKMRVIVTAADFEESPGVERLIQFQNLGVTAAIALLADDYDEAYEEIALECGAAEFLCRSRRHSIIARRLHLLADGIKRHTAAARVGDEDLRVGRLVVKPYCHRVLWRGREVPLTVTEVRIVRLLACQAGNRLSYRQIYDVVHGAGFSAGDGPDGHRTNVRSLIRKIRRKFTMLDKSFDLIENCPGLGYRWRGQPARLDAATRQA